VVQKPHQSQSINRYQLKTISKSGKLLWMDISTIPMINNGENIVVATLYDISLRKTYELELKETNKTLGASEEEIRQNTKELSATNDWLSVWVLLRA